MPPCAVAEIAREVEPCLDRAFYKTKRHNVYLVDDDPRLCGRPSSKRPPDHRLGHPRLRLHPEGGGAGQHLPLATDAGSSSSDILGFDALYPYVDDVAPLNVLVYPPGKGTGWHFDIAEFVVTLLIRSPRGGGVYEYAPFIRSEDDEGFGAVGAILAGERHGVYELSQPEGALVIFKGHHTLHRVTPVEGDLKRLVGVLS